MCKALLLPRSLASDVVEASSAVTGGFHGQEYEDPATELVGHVMTTTTCSASHSLPASDANAAGRSEKPGRISPLILNPFQSTRAGA